MNKEKAIEKIQYAVMQVASVYACSAIFEEKPERFYAQWKPTFCEYQDRVYDNVELPKGSIKKLIGRELSWEDEPVELKEE